MEIGAVLAGKYRIDRILGQGGMGIVVQATHMQLGTPVAVKFLLPEVLHNHDVVSRFLREAQAAVRLRSEHVARVIDVGTLDTGAPYMVLEYLDGTDLSAFPRSHLNTGLIIDLMLQACEALAEAHAMGIVHRDIKPANFFITRRADGSVLLKILDFGISKAATSQDHKLTGTQVVMGTPAYMSPEQMKSARAVDHRSDIWSLGVVMYELLEGRAPYEAETFTSLAIKVATEALRPLSVRLPNGLADVVHRCLEKEPNRRFRDIGELARALAPYARSQTQAAVTVERTSRLGMPVSQHATIAEDGPRPPSTLTASTGVMTDAPTQAGGKKRWPIFAGVGAVAAIAAFAIAMSARGGGGESTNAAAPATAPAATAPATNTATTPTPAPAQAATTTAPAPAATAPAATAPAATAPAAATAPPPTTGAPAATAQSPTPTPTPTTAATTAPPPTTATKPKTKKPRTATTKPATTTTPTNPATKPATPAQPDDILGTRN